MELQDQQDEFQRRGATLFVLGSLPESMDEARQSASSRGITYPILYDAETDATRKVGLWSDHIGDALYGLRRNRQIWPDR